MSGSKSASINVICDLSLLSAVLFGRNTVVDIAGIPVLLLQIILNVVYCVIITVKVGFK